MISPCEPTCQLGLSPCRGREVPQLCELVAADVPGYADLLRGLATADPAEAARLRRAGKPRADKGCKACHSQPAPSADPPT